MSWPRIVSRRTTRVSPWVEIIERGVELNRGGAPELYHAVAQRDYVAIVARTPDGKFPIVRQFRPALEKFTWELPAGTVEQGEPPEDSCRRELLEETGYPARTIHALGSYAPCTARLSNTIHSFFVETDPRSGSAEEGIEVKLVTPHELASLILSGDFTLQLHVGALLLAALRGHLDIAAFR
jgi:8-oxo-dGTP pyrophosphatase MutT (NUDIX family)